MQHDKIIMKTVHGHSNYVTAGIDIRFDELTYIKDAAVLQSCSNLTGVMTVRNATIVASGQKAEAITSSGNIATMMIYQTISGTPVELGNGTSLSGTTFVTQAQGY